jgi:hypothetical protein
MIFLESWWPLLELGSPSWRPKNCKCFYSYPDFIRMSGSGIGMIIWYEPETLAKDLPFFCIKK